jgi:hypothetical protein
LLVLSYRSGAGAALRSFSGLAFFAGKRDTIGMNIGEICYISSRLVFGALASFFAVVLWSKTRDAAWMFVVMGTIAAYIEIVYSVLDLAGVTETRRIAGGAMPLASIVLSNLPAFFFIGGFTVMVVRKIRRQ